MATVEEGLQSQIRNIEATYGRSMDEWTALIAASGLTRHGQIVSWLKSKYGLPHGAANRVALVALAAFQPPPAEDPVASLYADRSPAVRAIHDRIWAVVESLGDVEVAPKKGYLSLRRRTQFGMLKPAARHVDLGLILPGQPVTERLESAATFNALFTHRVRVRTEADVDDQVKGWIGAAYDRAG
jgi:uncharacterized protein DUF4287/uncharacterized protein DUF5655